MHEDPQISNFGEPGTGPLLEAGMVLAIEPMVNVGGPDVRVGGDNWAVYSADGSLAAHFEFTVAVTEDGPRILTPWHEGTVSRRLRSRSSPWPRPAATWIAATPRSRWSCTRRCGHLYRSTWAAPGALSRRCR